MAFSGREIRDLLVAWLALSLMFSLGFVYPRHLGLAYSLLIVGTAFVLHELSHKFVAQHYGRSAEFRLWWAGLVLGMMMAVATYVAFGPAGVLFFAAPGAVYVSPLFTGYSPLGFRVLMRAEGLISLAGPLVNLALGILFRLSTHFVGGELVYLFGRVSAINVFLGFFNMIPIPPLDGQKVFAWNKAAWAVCTVVLFALLVY
jgi:Zn-dependent protease